MLIKGISPLFPYNILLEYGADIKGRGCQYANTLRLASTTGHEDIALMLIDRGADLN
ncbi:hypothetical protein LY78DRAFT_649422 [Colletotrichum sublineola]|nr:hypothetical protein LY78DRAFT_649422 [Colletotrichum sublineola]